MTYSPFLKFAVKGASLGLIFVLKKLSADAPIVSRPCHMKQRHVCTQLMRAQIVCVYVFAIDKESYCYTHYIALPV